jgi:quercetin dioxygenase-like cupin family protein
MPMVRLAELDGRRLVPGAQARFVHTDNMTIAYWDFEPNVILPEHAHPHEQVANRVEGCFELTVEGEAMRLQPGSIVVIPPGATHSGRSITACRIIDVFHPVREDFR